jgi:hypothetical protein
VTVIDWDAYRRDYDRMGRDEQEAFYERVYAAYPVQKHFNAEACSALLHLCRPTSVVEIGGWRGELAKDMLSRWPGIMVWHNVEICRSARQQSECTDTRYHAVTEAVPADCLVTSHAIEHMRLYEVANYLDKIEPKAAYVAAPLSEDGQTWDNYLGSHVMQEGWKDVIAMFSSRGFDILGAGYSGGDVRCFYRFGRYFRGGARRSG